MKIGVLGSAYFQRYAEEVQREHLFDDVDLYTQVITDSNANFLKIAMQVEEEKCDAIVQGPADHQNLAPYTNIPSFIVKPGLLDILPLHSEIPDYDKTAIIFRAPNDMDCTPLEECFHVKYHKFFYHDEGRKEYRDLTSLRLLLEQLKREGYEYIIGNNVTVIMARSMGFIAYYYFGKQGIVEAIYGARQIVRNFERDKLYVREIRSILENNRSGVILAAAEDGRINYANETALTILSKKREELYDRSMQEFLPAKVTEQLLDPETPATDLQFSLYGVDVIGNAVPIQLANSQRGICILFENTSRILEYETMIRREIKRKSFSTHYSFRDIIGESPALRATVEQAKRFAKSNSTVLINAETGAGKEVFAQSIHAGSPRRQYPFVAINCGSIPDTLIESELFGYESGAFTGASAKGKSGLIELANHGSVFLDDIDSLSPNFQAKLLRVLQEREIIHIGGSSPIPVDVRFIVATNRNLQEMVQSGVFRSDLYYRLNVLRLQIPPLRERPEDIPALYEYYLNDFSNEIFRRIRPCFMRAFQPAFHYAYPGNVRELISVAERFIALVDTSRLNDEPYLGELLTYCLNAAEQPPAAASRPLPPLSGNFEQDVAEAEQAVLRRYLQQHDGNMTALAKQLGISRTTLYNKLRKL